MLPGTLSALGTVVRINTRDSESERKNNTTNNNRRRPGATKKRWRG